MGIKTSKVVIFMKDFENFSVLEIFLHRLFVTKSSINCNPDGANCASDLSYFCANSCLKFA